LAGVVSTSVLIPPDSKYIQYQGRMDANYTFEWSGIEIFAQFNSTSIGFVLTEHGSNQYNMFVDGTFIKIFNGTRGVNTYTIASDLSTSETHSILITKRTEVFYGSASFGGFVIDDDGALVAPPPLSGRRIEFIGDSITCGFGVEGTAPCTYSEPTENAYNAYGAVTGRLLNAQYQQESWSGIGLVRNAGDPNTTSKFPLPTRFPFILPSTFSEPWNFANWVPQAVVINLGTNDFSGGKIVPTQEEFQNTYIQFIANITKAYNPPPKFFLVCGPMEDSNYCPYTQNVATQLGQTYVNLEGLLVTGDWGCDGHPGVSGHLKMANATAAIISKVLNW